MKCPVRIQVVGLGKDTKTEFAGEVICDRAANDPGTITGFQVPWKNRETGISSLDQYDHKPKNS